MSESDRSLGGRIVFLSSGGGGNLKFIVKAIELGLLPAWQVVGVIADRQCPAVRYADSIGIRHHVVDFSQDGQDELLSVLSSFESTVVVTNVHKILRPPIVDRVRDALINVHYSILPAFGGSIGSKTVQDAFDFGSKIIGVTTHRVSEDLDRGKPIVQIAIPVDGEYSDATMDLVFRAGALSLLFSLTEWNGANAPRQNGRKTHVMTISDRPCIVSPSCVEPVGLDERFWRSLKA
jgi:phosphoribosylglycinamide formyltransferase-1